MSEATGEGARVQLPRPPINSRMSCKFVPEFLPTDPRAAIPRSLRGSPGTYRITFVLGIPGKESFRTDVDFERFLSSGESLLVVADNIVSLQVDLFNDQESVRIMFHANEAKTLARAELRLSANHEKAAIRSATNLVLPLLSWWSYAFDVALDVVGYEVYEELTDIRNFRLSFLGRQKSVHDPPHPVPLRSKQESRRVLAAYREAMNTENPFYRLICLQRVLEGVGKMRAERRVRLLRAGRTPVDPQERIPAEGDQMYSGPPVDCDPEAFRPYFGQKFTRVLQEKARVLRNAVTHLDPNGESLCADDFDDLTQCEEVMPVIRYIARRMLQNKVVLDMGEDDGPLSR